MIKTSSFSIAITGIPGSGKSSVLAQLQNNQSKKPLFTLQEIQSGYQLNPLDQQFPDSYKQLVVGEMNYGTPWDGHIFCLDCRSAADQFYVLSQLLDLRKPLLVVLTQINEAKKSGITVRLEQIRAMLDCPVVEFHSNNNGIEIIEALENLMAQPKKKEYTHWRPSIALAQAYNILDEKWLSEHSTLNSGNRLLEGLRLISDENAHSDYASHPRYTDLVEHLLMARDKITQRGDDWSRTEALQRAVWSGKIIEICFNYEKPIVENKTYSLVQKIMHIPEPFLYSTLIFSAILFLIALIFLLK